MMSDDEFVLKCDLPDVELATRAALIARRAAGKMGCVDPQFIMPDDDYPSSLEVLPGWESIDWVEFVMAIEEASNVEIPDEAAEMIVGSWSSHATIKDLVHRVYQYLLLHRDQIQLRREE